MKLSRSWLNNPRAVDGLSFNTDDATLSATLTRLGLEVESVTSRGSELAAFTVAKIITAEQHPNADKLRLCSVDTNQGRQQVVCGAPNARAGLTIAYAPSGAVIPRTGAVLKPTAIRGVDSNGMCCSAWELMLSEDHEGIIELPDHWAVGTPVAEALGLNETVFDIAITPNRADCLGVAGIRRDLFAAGLGKAATPPKLPAIAGGFISPIGLKMAAGAEAGCPYFTGRLVRGVTNGPSPEWLQNLLLSVGLKPISALVDVTNYLLYEFNRPLHVFDAAKISGAITVRLAGDDESFTALNGKDFIVPTGSVVIADDGGVLALGGVMGGAKSGVSFDTRDVFIESAYFTPAAISRAGRLLNLLSDSRARFERGIDPQSCLTGLEMATALIIELCGGEPSQVVTVGAPLPAAAAIEFDPQLVERLGGLAVADSEQQSILKRLGFAVTVGAGTGRPWQVVPPSWRGDCRQPADLVEEVLRVADYDRIPLTPLPRPAKLPSRAIGIATARTMRLRRNLAARGFDEVVSWAFLDRRDALRFGGGDEGLTLLNPIASDLSDMRPSPLPNLLAAAARNLARGESHLAQFEIGPGFRDSTIKGQRNLAVALRVETAAAKDWLSETSDPTGFYGIKGDLLALLESMGIGSDGLVFEPGAPDWYHPGQSAVIKLGHKMVIGWVGVIHPSVSADYDLTGRVVGFELDLDALPLPKIKAGKARPRLEASTFQKLHRDFAFVVPSQVGAAVVLKAARGADRVLIQEVVLFDLYQGAGLAEGMKSLALRVVIQPTVATLTDSEIEALSQKVISAVESASGGKIR
ncbi:MAG: phenylalanine--tRNA ligase subunit beta [Candidatus Pacebacteria bacterium]|nr:phenylalanine--tRNA ligase subunit beta [Candidatus Paceibacterota bacterium]